MLKSLCLPVIMVIEITADSMTLPPVFDCLSNDVHFFQPLVYHHFNEHPKLFLSLFLLLNIMPALLLERQCGYLMGTQIISCENAITSIKDVTDLIDIDTNVVIIKGGHSLRISRACHKYEGCKHISTYQISKINDLDIEPDGFSGLSNLVHLRFNDNGLYRLENRVFYGLEKLQHLELTNCSIEHIADKAH
ncbi:Leucine rich repeat [Popillia japonica]|uniref:Leucine rich repeat n=1 Tax=Popillia japonica TaxID=7064 RepID=A0AAW1N1L9_POPJA